jgi:hypothetical protein
MFLYLSQRRYGAVTETILAKLILLAKLVAVEGGVANSENEEDGLSVDEGLITCVGKSTAIAARAYRDVIEQI